MAKKKHKRRKERGIHNRAIISSSDNWPCYMKEISIQINMVSLELYHRELHLKELTSQSPYSVSQTYTYALIYSTTFTIKTSFLSLHFTFNKIFIIALPFITLHLLLSFRSLFFPPQSLSLSHGLSLTPTPSCSQTLLPPPGLKKEVLCGNWLHLGTFKLLQ